MTPPYRETQFVYGAGEAEQDSTPYTPATPPPLHAPGIDILYIKIASH